MRDCEHCIHKIPVLKDGEWTVECESFDCEFISREACLLAYRNKEPKSVSDLVDELYKKVKGGGA